ncbi:hypothetical protein D210916BOD24_02740 [Alteromonas sp. D210916BOD_24]|uniref:hybrid sensor histidine kinase/response regulator n=1 Tax=Alteromonas sp. D210916BOD_24 TaxID=3157618 RepID=UPI00399C59C2
MTEQVRSLKTPSKVAQHVFTFLKVNFATFALAAISFLLVFLILNNQHKYIYALEKHNSLGVYMVTTEHRIQRFQANPHAGTLEPLQQNLSVLYQKIYDNFSLEIDPQFSPSALTDVAFENKQANLRSDAAHSVVQDTLLLLHTLVQAPPEQAFSLLDSGFSLVPMMNAMRIEENTLILKISEARNQLFLVLIFSLMGFVVQQIAALMSLNQNANDSVSQAFNITPSKALDEDGAYKKELLQLIIHEFRAPISVIISALELIPNMEAQRDRLIQQAEQSSYRLLSLTNNLTELLAVNIEEENQTQRVDLISLLDECISPFSVQVKDRKVELEIHCSHSVPHFIESNPTAIAKVITNILDNAVKFTTTGLIDVTFTTKVKHKNIYLVVIVSDTGIGIDEETQKRMFERFFRGKNASTKRFPGAGIGLSVTKRSIDFLKGSIKVTSTLGVGSEFKITFPITPVDDDAAVIPAPSHAKFAVVDDLEISRMHIQSILATQGFSAQTFSSGAELLNLHDEVLQFTAIIADLYMPGMTGLELVETLHAMYGERTPPIIVLSATPDIANIVANANVTIYQSFVKPIDKYRFVDTLHSLATNSSKLLEPTKKANILVVEDEPINAEMVEFMLTCMGHTVTVCYTGEEAIVRSNELTFDCVLLDINLPDINGLEVARILKERHPALAIIALTANSHRNDKEASVEAGIRYHLVKPITFQELKNTLKLTI